MSSKPRKVREMEWEKRLANQSRRKKIAKQQSNLWGFTEMKAVPKTFDMIVTDMFKSFSIDFCSNFGFKKRVFNICARFLLANMSGLNIEDCNKRGTGWKIIKGTLKKNWVRNKTVGNLKSLLWDFINNWMNKDREKTVKYIQAADRAIDTEDGRIRRKGDASDVDIFRELASKSLHLPKTHSLFHTAIGIYTKQREEKAAKARAMLANYRAGLSGGNNVIDYEDNYDGVDSNLSIGNEKEQPQPEPKKKSTQVTKRLTRRAAARGEGTIQELSRNMGETFVGQNSGRKKSGKTGGKKEEIIKWRTEPITEADKKKLDSQHKALLAQAERLKAKNARLGPKGRVKQNYV